MKFILKTFLFVVLFFITFFIFLPKENIYFKIEHELAKKHIIISDENIKEKLFGLKLEDMQIYYDGINSALINNLDFTSYLFFSKIEIQNLRIAKSLENVLPSKIDKIDIKYKIFSLNEIDINAKGDFGEFEGSYKIFDKKILGELKPSSLMKSKYRRILSKFKLKNGKYKYEFSF